MLGNEQQEVMPTNEESTTVDTQQGVNETAPIEGTTEETNPLEPQPKPTTPEIDYKGEFEKTQAEIAQLKPAKAALDHMQNLLVTAQRTGNYTGVNAILANMGLPAIGVPSLQKPQEPEIDEFEASLTPEVAALFRKELEKREKGTVERLSKLEEMVSESRRMNEINKVIAETQKKHTDFDEYQNDVAEILSRSITLDEAVLLAKKKRELKINESNRNIQKVSASRVLQPSKVSLPLQNKRCTSVLEAMEMAEQQTGLKWQSQD